MDITDTGCSPILPRGRSAFLFNLKKIVIIIFSFYSLIGAKLVGAITLNGVAQVI